MKFRKLALFAMCTILSAYFITPFHAQAFFGNTTTSQEIVHIVSYAFKGWQIILSNALSAARTRVASLIPPSNNSHIEQNQQVAVSAPQDSLASLVLIASSSPVPTPSGPPSAVAPKPLDIASIKNSLRNELASQLGALSDANRIYLENKLNAINSSYNSSQNFLQSFQPLLPNLLSGTNNFTVGNTLNVGTQNISSAGSFSGNMGTFSTLTAASSSVTNLTFGTATGTTLCLDSCRATWPITPPGGSSNGIQFNNGGNFGGDTNLTWTSSTQLLTVTGTSTFLNGNVGIGTSTPSTFFTIASSSKNYLTVNSGGNIGIGTSTPTGLLTIVSSTAPTATSTFLVVMPSGNIGIGTSTPASRFVIASTTTSTILTVSDSGNIGIGSNSPGRLLDIAGVASGGTNPAIRLTNNAGPYSLNIEAQQTTIIYTGGSANALALSGAGNNNGQFVLNSDNTIYIGGGSGTGALVNIATNTSALNMPILNVSAGASPSQNIFQVTNNGAGTKYLTVDSSGKVIVGTLSGLSDNLQVQDSLKVQGTSASLKLKATSAGISNISFRLDDTNDSAAFIMSGDAGNSTIQLFSYNKYALGLGAGGTEVIRIASTTKSVGIGTTTPQTFFSIASGSANYFNITGSGNIGIGTSTPAYKLVVASGTDQADLYIPKGGLCVDNNNSGCPTTPNQGQIYASATAITAIDLAENYPTTDATLEPGEIVAADTANPEFVVKAAEKYKDKMLGIISTAPGVLLGRRIENSAPVALAGRVPLKINLEGGAINIGDPLTISSVNGVAKKATSAGPIIGYALAPFDSSATSTLKIQAFVHIGWYFSADETSSSSLIGSVLNSFKNLGISIAQDVIQVKNIIADTLTGNRLCLQDVCINRDDLERLLNSSGSAPANPPSPISPLNSPATSTPPDASSTHADASSTSPASSSTPPSTPPQPAPPNDASTTPPAPPPPAATSTP